MTLHSLVSGSRRFGAFVLWVGLPLLLAVFTLGHFRGVDKASAAAKLSPDLIDQALERMGCTVWREGGADWFAQVVWQGSCGKSVQTVVTAPEGFSDADLAMAVELLSDAPGVAIWLDGSEVTPQGLKALGRVKDLQAVSVSAAQATPVLVELVSESPKLRVICLDPKLSAEAIESATTSLRKVRPTVEVFEWRPKLGC